MLKGQAKTNYQRNYMRKHRLLDLSVRPIVQPNMPEDRMPELDDDGNPMPDYEN